MTIRIYNTLTRKKEVFEPVEPGRVGMYVCGPTVYDSCHIGHARSVVVFDVIARHFRERGFEVTHTRNFTDIDDKIINRAREMGVDFAEVSNRYIDEFYRDMDALNVIRADFEPRATEHIDSIIEIIDILMGRNMAYRAGGDVFFHVESFPEYGRLSGRRLEDMEAGARVDVDARKKSPFDFALWKSSKPGEPSWESPWGPGRPGWHIECSAMSKKILGKTFDIHGGGMDLVFPHHENEKAQSEGAFGGTFAKYWVHNGFVNINSEKMSKSLGNFTVIRDVLETWHPDCVRLFLLSNHYRSPIDFSEKAMEEAAAGLDKIRRSLFRAEKQAAAPSGAGAGKGEKDGGRPWMDFAEAMDDDFNTARGIGVLFNTVRDMNREMDGAAGRMRGAVASKRNDILRMCGVLGILADPPAQYFADMKARVLKEKAVDSARVEEMIRARSLARKEKNWKEADRIRDELEKMGVAIEDRPDGTAWEISG
ncbi:Cysteine--tRNA ligase [Candidatus Desulfarcum epimagneticum]|uniref:Cysteine--tRNA ligase n=1 Tax=uncultured Desulfobacteraceae bacterium TaxID=218296 RepID=A0A484HD42_9BACT|nr:Cysteine--tRNA ligase [uncultured Desulfobacteraceae bacterium]